MNTPENAQAKSLIINYVVIILLLSLLWLLYEGVSFDLLLYIANSFVYQINFNQIFIDILVCIWSGVLKTKQNLSHGSTNFLVTRHQSHTQPKRVIILEDVQVSRQSAST